MSYILDALKRADAERARGAVPGLHTQPLASPADTDRGSAKPLLGWLVSAAVVIAIAALGLWRWQATTPSPLIPLVAPLAAPTSPTPAAPPIPAPVPVISPVPVAQPTPTKSIQPGINGADAAASGTPPTRVARSTASAPASPASSEAVLEPVEPLLSELPEDLRRQIPALTITGSVFASDPHQRLLLVNNQVWPQGSEVVIGVTLQDIQPHIAVFSFQQTRFRVRY